MKENFFYFTINVRSQAKNMREVRGEEGTDYWFYFNGFALWIGRDKQVELNAFSYSKFWLDKIPALQIIFPYCATFFFFASGKAQGIVSFSDSFMFPTQLLFQLSAAFGLSWFFCTKNPLEMCDSCEFSSPPVGTDTLQRVAQAGGCVCVEPLDLVGNVQCRESSDKT